MPLAPVHLHIGVIEPEPVEDEKVVAILVPKSEERLSNWPRHDAEAAVLALDVHLQETVDEPEVAAGGCAAGAAVVAPKPPSKNDVEALERLAVEEGDLLGLILEVAIHHD